MSGSKLEAFVTTSVGVLRNVAACLKKNVIPLAPKIVRPVLAAMEQQYKAGVLGSACALFTVMAKYSGSAFLEHVPIIIPKVFSILIDPTTDDDIHSVANSLLLEIFLAIGPTAFSPYLKRSVDVMLDARSNDINIADTLLFLCLLNEYPTISTFYPGTEADTLLSRVTPVMTIAMKGLSLLRGMLSHYDVCHMI